METAIALLTGGATGLLGTLLSGALGAWQRRQKHRQEVELRRLDVEIARAEAERVERVAAVEAESEESARAWAAMEASHRAAGKRWSSGESGWLVLVDVVRGLIRPALTLGLVGLVGCIYFVGLAEGSSFDEAAIRARIVDTVLYLSSTCVLWWFGSRAQGKAGS